MLDNQTAKKVLRAECLALRKAIPVSTQSKQLTRHVLEFIPAHVKTVAGYRAIKGEIDVSDALEKLAACGHDICLPVVADAVLVFRAWKFGSLLEKDAYGIEIPAGGKAVTPDAVIVPLLAFDAAGHRLGYGAGYYDRTIAQLRKHAPNVMIVGAAYAAQRVAKIPADDHDEKLDALVTEEGITHFK